MAKYKEANPSIFTTVTFPFLFGVMFGDIAHGLILFFFGLYLTFSYNPNSTSAGFLNIIMPHRYLFLLMGFFATYCGFIYNEFLSMDLNLFGSCYIVEGVKAGQGFSRTSPDCVYPFGLDPVWMIS